MESPQLTKYSHCEDGSIYDTTRQPVGLDVFKGLYPEGSEALHIAELGCGTGNYLEALDRLYEKSDLCGVDRSPAMLNACEDKIMASNTTNRLRVVEADLLAGNVPGVANHSFHMVYSCQVLHHLGGLDGVRRLFQTAHNLCMPNGYFVVNWCTPEQQAGIWHLHLIPRALQEIQRRSPDIISLIHIAEQVGWKVREMHVIREELLQEESVYFDAKNVLDPGFRIGDSTWTLATPDEVEMACEGVRVLSKEEGSALVRTLDLPRQISGQSTILVFERSA